MKLINYLFYLIIYFMLVAWLTGGYVSQAGLKKWEVNVNMCQAVKLAEQLQEAYSLIINANNYYTNQVRLYDKMQQDILHHVERKNLSETEMIEIVKMLKKVRLERRKAKNEHELLVSLCTLIRPVKHVNTLQEITDRISRAENKKIKHTWYNYRTDLFKKKPCTAIIVRPKYDFVIVEQN